MIILKDNNGFKWNVKNNIYVKGYIYIDNKVYIDDQMILLFESILSYDEFSDFIKICNGNFAVIIEKCDEIWFCVDRERSFGLYYSIDGKYVSDSVQAIVERNQEMNLDDVSISEQLLSSYVYGNNTAYMEIKQLQLGECAKIHKCNIYRERYYKHFFSDKTKNKIDNEEFLLDKLDIITKNVFDRLVKSLQNKRVVIPLSGGYDSRYIAAMLKKLGYNNVICYTYGDKNQYEVQYSKKVAEKLGYKWYFIEYSDEKWSTMLDEKFYEYCNYCHNFSSVPHIQEFLALRELKEQNIITDKDIIINGFCGDLPAGSFVKPKSDEQYVNYDIEWIAQYIFNQNYNHIELNDFKKKKDICERIKIELESLEWDVKSFDDFINIYEAWFTGARPSKWVVNSNRVYEFFGMQWRMPLWDNEFIEFWYSVNNNLRRDTYLYQKYLFEKLFIPMEIDMKKPSFIRSLSIEYNKSFKKKIKMKALHIITLIQLYFGVVLYKKNDVNNYLGLTMLLIKKINNKKYLNHKSLYAHQVMAFWWCETLYGTKKIKNICEREREIWKS